MLPTNSRKKIPDVYNFWFLARNQNLKVILKLAEQGYLPYFVSGREYKAIKILNKYRGQCMKKLFGKNKYYWTTCSVAFYIGPMSSFFMLQRVMRTCIPVAGVMNWTARNWVMDYKFFNHIFINPEFELWFGLRLFNITLEHMIKQLDRNYLELLLLSTQFLGYTNE